MRSDRRHPSARRRSLRPARLLALALTLVLGACAASASAATVSMTASALPQMAGAGQIACASATSCLIEGQDTAGNAAIETISSGQPGPVTELPDTSFTPLALACPASGRCLLAGDVLDASALGQSGAIVPVTAGVPGATETVAGTQALNDLACASASACTAAGTAADGTPATVTVGGTSPGPVDESPNPGFTIEGLACPAAGACALAGEINGDAGARGAVAGVTGAGPGPVTAVPSADSLSGVACPAADPCVAVGSALATDASGNPTIGPPLLVAIDGGHPGAVTVPSVPAGGELTAVGCPPQGECVALGDDNANDTLLETIGPAGAGPVQVLPPDANLALLGLTAVACPSATTCFAVGQDLADDAVVVRISLPATAGAPGGSTGPGGSGGRWSPAAGHAGGSSSSQTGSRHRRAGAGRPKAAAPRRRRPSHGSGHRRASSSPLLTRLLLAVTWPARTSPGTAPGDLTAVLRLQSGTGAGIDGARVVLQVRQDSPGAAWRTVATAITRRIGRRAGEARFSLASTHGERVVLRAAAPAGRRHPGLRTRGVRVAIL